MKIRLLTAVMMACCLVSLAAREMGAVSAYNPVDIPRMNQPTVQYRTPPTYTFSINPMALMTSYYDYMIGGFHGNPLQVVPNTTSADYFMTYHGKRTPTSHRRVFYSYIQSGELANNVEIGNDYRAEGYPTMATDPVSGKPMYAWHGNFDTDTPYEVTFVSDAFLSGIAGLFNDEQLIVNNPITVVSGNITTSNNEFLWPQMVVGPSPIGGKRRVYVMCRNATGNGVAISENPLIAMADFDANDFEMGNPLTWTYRTVPELDAWNTDMGMWRRPFQALVCDQAGNIYLCGYHIAATSGIDTPIMESDLDVFKSSNYGMGAWTRMTNPSTLPSWNPPVSATNPTGYFTSNGLPLADSELFWRINNSGHMNAVVDSNGKIHMPALWALTNVYGEYYPNLQFMKELIFDTISNELSVRDIYPQKHPDDTFNTYYQPWDIEAPFGVVDSWIDYGTESAPLMGAMWNFPYWDASAHNDAMMFHYNNHKISRNLEQEMLAVVWQNCTRAWMGPANNTNPWFNTPEIFISVSPDNGITWGEPIILNNIDTPQLAGIKPMWVYPANKIRFDGWEDGRKVGKLGLMFYDDYTWGANAITAPVHPNNDGGRVMFTELRIVFPESIPAADPFGTPVGLANMQINAAVFINNQPAALGDKLAAYVETNGEFQLRGKATLVSTGGDGLGCSLPLFTSADNELIQFRIWDASTNLVLPANQTVQSIVDGEIGTWPTDLILIHSGADLVVQDPVFHPAAGIYSSPQSVYISSSTAGAEIRYSLDGSDPTPQSSLYTQALQVPGNSVVQIKARAYLDGWSPSDVIEANYSITGVLAAPSFSPVAGTYQTAQNVVISSSMPDASIYYTLDGSYPTSSSTLYTAPIALSENSITLIRARVFKENWETSPLNAGHYTITGTLPTPMFFPPQGTYSSALEVTLSCTIPGATIRYTLDGSDPDSNSPAYTSAIHLMQNTDIRAKAFKTDWISSDIAEAHYDVSVANYPQQDTPPYSGIYSLYPNPFSLQTGIRLGIKGERQAYTLGIYNIRGEKVYHIAGESSGFFELNWDGRDNSGRRLAAGIYLLRFRSTGVSQTRKLILH